MTLFVDGEPLDVDKLNELASDVKKIKAEFDSFTKTYDANNKRVVSTVPIITTGSLDMNAGPNSSPRTVSIPSNSFKSDDSLPTIVVTASNAGNRVVTFAVDNVSRTGFSLDAYSDKAGNVTANWIAIAIRTLS